MAGYFRVLFFASLLVALSCCLVGLGPGALSCWAWWSARLDLNSFIQTRQVYTYETPMCNRIWIIDSQTIPVYPMSGDFVPYPYPIFVSYSYPNRGIPHGLVGIGSPLTSLHWMPVGRHDRP
jgi:hypothetical protein